MQLTRHAFGGLAKLYLDRQDTECHDQSAAEPWDWDAFKATFKTKFTTVRSNKVDARQKLKAIRLQEESEQSEAETPSPPPPTTTKKKEKEIRTKCFQIRACFLRCHQWIEFDNKELMDYFYESLPVDMAEKLETTIPNCKDWGLAVETLQ